MDSYFDKFSYGVNISGTKVGNLDFFKRWLSNLPFMDDMKKHRFFDYLVITGYFEKPASLNHHGKNYGDLFAHSYNVAETLVYYTTNLGLMWLRDESPMIVGLFHDLCKVDNYISDGRVSENPRESSFCYNDKQLMKGHGDKSVIMLSQFMTLTEEEILCIRYHMGVYEKDDWDGFDRAIRHYPNVLYTHTADMYASKVKDI